MKSQYKYFKGYNTKITDEKDLTLKEKIFINVLVVGTIASLLITGLLLMSLM